MKKKNTKTPDILGARSMVGFGQRLGTVSMKTPKNPSRNDRKKETRKEIKEYM